MEMGARLFEVARDEHTLSDELNQLDQQLQLLRDLRTVFAEHDLRREEILRELQFLADNMGTLPTARPRGVARVLISLH